LSPLLLEKAKQHRWAEQVALMEERRKRAIELLQANLQVTANLLLVVALRGLLVLSESELVKAMLLLRELARLLLALPEKSLVKANLLAETADWRPPLLVAAEGKQQEMHRRLEEDFAVLQARARRCLRCPGPFAFSQVALAARRCNRAARCGGYPIFVRYRPPRNRRVLAGCDSKCSRSQHKPVRRGRTFPIAAADKCRCLPHRTAD
jgi:hypothetical protein